MSYMEGNAVYIMGASVGATDNINIYVRGKLQIIFDKCIFKQNYGIS
jgi:hypothetical protein